MKLYVDFGRIACIATMDDRAYKYQWWVFINDLLQALVLNYVENVLNRDVIEHI